MKTIIRSGRFGINRACLEVYAENTGIFNAWKAGKADVDFGNYQTYLDAAVLYKELYTVDDMGVTYPSTETGCINMDCVDLAEELLAEIRDLLKEQNK